MNYNLIKQYYNYPLPIFIMLGGFAGMMVGVVILEEETHKKIKPIQGFGIIIGGFSIGLISGVLYPITGIITSGYLINKIKNNLD